MRAFLLAPIAFFAAVAASDLEQRSPYNMVRSSLTARDLVNENSIPDQCKKSCSGIVNSVNSCGENVSCLCTNKNGQLLKTCIDCVVKLANSNDATNEGQATLDAFTSACQTAGVTVNSQTVNPNSAMCPAANGGVLAAALVGAAAYLL